MSSTKSLIGSRVLRTEDPGLLTGFEQFAADLRLEDCLRAVFVRSDVAHGIVRAIHVEDVRGMPGVVAVWTAAELGIAPHHGSFKVHDDFLRPPLAVGRVRFVGDAIAVVFAATLAEAEDGAAAVWAEIDPLPAQIDPELSLMPGAELIFPDHGSNSAMSIVDPNRLDIDAISDVVVRGRYVNQRMAVAPMETDACAAAPGEDGRIRVWPSTQAPHRLRDELAAVLGWSSDEIHITTPRVGGGFGGKAGLHHEYAVVVKGARVLDQPVLWQASRSEDLRAMPHGRGQIQYCELGCRRDGTFTGLRVRMVADAGAYPGIGALLPGATRRMAQGTYAFPSIQFDVVVGVTNTTPTGAYRGAGRPEATALLERVVDQAALELGLDPIELRQRNLLDDDVFPFESAFGNVYDSGRYSLPLQVAAETVGYHELRVEQAARRKRGAQHLLGIGVASYVEITAGGPAVEWGAVEVHGDGSATVLAGTLAHGQGHQTSYAMIVAAQTGIPFDRIRLVDGDTDRVRQGGGTAGSRSLQLGGSAIHGATEILVSRARQLAADLLEAAPADIFVDVEAGTVGVVGVPATALSWGELASRAPEPLAAELLFDQSGATYPFGAHIAVVEVDVETGRARLVRHVAVDDCGVVLNPLIVEGQQHGGVAAGVGQALFEEVRYDAEGNLLTSTFAEYGIMSAAELPGFEVRSTQTPTPLNPLGAKGIGEAATIGSTPAVQNAVIDAVAHLGIRHLDLPCTPERVWRAIRSAQEGTPPDPWREPPPVFVGRPAIGMDEIAIDEAQGV